MRDTRPEPAGGPLGFGKKKLESLYVLTFLSLQDKEFCYKFQYRLTSAPVAPAVTSPKSGWSASCAGGTGGDVGHGRGQGLAVGLARRPVLPPVRGSSHAALTAPTLLNCVSGSKRLRQRNSRTETALRRQAGASSSSWGLRSRRKLLVRPTTRKSSNICQEGSPQS